MATELPAEVSANRVKTGIAGLDEVLNGGFPEHRLYLIEGDPGAGKTTLALQFLMEGARLKEPVLYVTLSETADELQEVAASHGWSLHGIEIFELLPSERALMTGAAYTVFEPADVELSDSTRAVLDQVERVKPTRVVLDSLSELRLIAGDALRYRRQILAFKRYFAERRCTVLLLDDRSTTDDDSQVRSIAHGVIALERMGDTYGIERRRLNVLKIRGARYRGGYHDFRIISGGEVVFPRLVSAEHRTAFEREQISSGIPNLDALLGGGLQRGTSTLIVGPAGVGKSTVAMQFVSAAAQRGEFCCSFLFEEALGTFFARSKSLGLDLEGLMKDNRLNVRQIDPAQLSPGEFTSIVQQAVFENQARLVVVDSLNGYVQAMPNEKFVTMQMHELLMFLNQQGVTTLVIAGQTGLLGMAMGSPVDFSYLADNIIVVRYFEAHGEVRKALSIIKKRTGSHESAIRELHISPQGIVLGDTLKEFRGVLTGIPEYTGDKLGLFQKRRRKAPADGNNA